MENFADLANSFNQKLVKIDKQIKINLPQNYKLMNPFAQGIALDLSREFYNKFYSDQKHRTLILGINPGRHGAGLTGIPFTDSKHLENVLQINSKWLKSYEPSAFFIYKMIEKYGGVKKFYTNFYINSPLPLGLLKKQASGSFVNANYYDTKALLVSSQPLIDYAMSYYQKMSLNREVVYCLGQGKNYHYLKKQNTITKYFKQIIPLAHPRYIVQYKSKFIDNYIDDYLAKFSLEE